MTRLVLGVLLWSLVHMLPGLTKDLKKNMVGRIGEYPYKGVFLLFMLLSIYLIISGWTSMTPVEPEVLAALYTVPEWGGHAAAVLVLPLATVSAGAKAVPRPPPRRRSWLLKWKLS